VNAEHLKACLDHLEAAEELLLHEGPSVELARLSYVVEMVRRRHGLPERPMDLSELLSGSQDATHQA